MIAHIVSIKQIYVFALFNKYRKISYYELIEPIMILPILDNLNSVKLLRQAAIGPDKSSSFSLDIK